VGLNDLSNRTNVTLSELEDITSGVSAVLADMSDLLEPEAGTTDSTKVEAGQVLQAAISSVVDAAVAIAATLSSFGGENATTNATTLVEITTEALNISVQAVEPQPGKPVSFGGQGAMEDTAIQFEGLDASGSVTISAYTTNTEVVGGSVNDTSSFAGKTLSFSITVNSDGRRLDESEINATTTIALPYVAGTTDSSEAQRRRRLGAGSSGVSDQIGQMSNRQRFEDMNNRLPPPSGALECGSWDESSREWSTTDCSTVELSSKGLGCKCAGQTPGGTYRAIKVPLEVVDDQVEVLSLDPQRREATHCICRKDVEVTLTKTDNASASRNISLDVVQSMASTFRSWRAQLRGEMNVSLVQLPKDEGDASDGLAVRLSAIGLAETPSGYTESATVALEVDADNAAGCNNVSVAFRARIVARTDAKSTVWGWAAPGAPCRDAEPVHKTSVLLGQSLSINFTACDFEGLSVKHTLPTSRKALTDMRKFRALLMSERGPVAAEARGIGNGRYQVAVTPIAIGNYALHLQLGPEGADDASSSDATPADGAVQIEVGCPQHLVHHQGVCVCGFGKEPKYASGTSRSDESNLLPAECVPCGAGHYKSERGNDPCNECQAGSVQPDTGSAKCVACLRGEYQRFNGMAQCGLCDPQTTSSPPFTSCSECDRGTCRYSSEEASTYTCKPCHPLATCPLNSTTVPTIVLNDGAWRLTNRSTALQRCRASGGYSPCIGGDESGVGGEGYCRSGYTGFRCEVCTDGDQFFDAERARCKDCRPPGAYAAIYICLLVLPLLVLWLLSFVERRGNPQGMARTIKKLRVSAKNAALLVKLRIIVGFAQIGAAASTFSIEVPSLLRPLIRALEWLELDIWGELFIPHACLGGYKVYMLITATAPLGLMLAVFIVRLSRRLRRARERALLLALSDTLPWVLGIVLLLSPTVASAAFGAFHCRRVEAVSRPLKHRSFLWSSLDVECDSDEAAEIRAVAYAILAVWAVAPLIGLAILLVRVRRSVLTHTPSRLSSASRVVWQAYEAADIWWAWMDLFRRLFLCGALLFVPEEAAFLRLFAALLFSLVILFMQIFVRPYADKSVEMLAAAVQTVVTILLLGYSYIYVFVRFEALPTDRSTIVWVISFSSPDDVAAVLVALVSTLGAVTFAIAIRVALVDTANSDFILRETRKPPELSKHPGQNFHLFLSHTWNTGQDQCAAIKRQLQLHLPGIKVFLDVDDLRDIGALETSVEKSMVVAIFLSRGYFTSHNCLREVAACSAKSKPIVLVHEADELKGGISLEQARDQCPEEYREYVFDHPGGGERLPYTWHRVREFQMRSLCLIASQMLASSPKYAASSPKRRRLLQGLSGRFGFEIQEEAASSSADAAASGQRKPFRHATVRELELSLPKDPTFDVLGYDQPPVLCVSDHNPGAREIVEELIQCFKPSERPKLDRTYGAERSTESISERSVLERSRSTYFVLYLHSDTWLSDEGAALAQEVQAVLDLRASDEPGRIGIVLLHENDVHRGGCSFARFFQTTPTALLDNGIYSDIAIAMHAEPYREVSFLLAARAIGAKSRVLMRAAQMLTRNTGARNVIRLLRASRDGTVSLSAPAVTLASPPAQEVVAEPEGGS